MNDEGAVRRFKVCSDVYLLYIALATLVIGWHDTHTQIGWTLGDWLINYRGGFVRRGLIGELVFQLSSLVPISQLYLIVGIVFLLYLVIWLSVRELLSRSNWGIWVVFAVLSPATLAFGVLDDRAGFHKEVLFFAGLSLLLLFLKANVSDRFLALYLSLVCAVCVLCHEPLFVYLPYYLAALVIGKGSWRQALRIAAIPFVIASICFYETAKHPGGQSVAAQICASVQHLGASVCEGSIGYISHDRAFARQELLTEMHLFHYSTHYPLFAVLSLLPIAAGFFSLWKDDRIRRDLINISCLSALSMIGSVVLFLYATDWGRWIHIHIFSLFLLLLFLSSRVTVDTGDTVKDFLAPGHRAKIAFTALLLILYTCIWNMPGYGNKPTHGYVDMLSHFSHHARKVPQNGAM